MGLDNVVVIGELPDEREPAHDVVTIDEAADEAPLPKHAVANSDGTVTLKLFHPVALKWKRPGAAETTSEQYEAFTMRRLVGKDMMAIGAAAAEERSLVGIALSAGIPKHLFRLVFERMDGADVIAAGAVLSHFLSSGATTGR